MNDQLSAQSAALELKNGPLLLPVLARSIATFGARADLSVDRIDRAVKVASIVAACSQNQQLSTSFEFENGRLSLCFIQPDSPERDQLLRDLAKADLPQPATDSEHLTFLFSTE